MREIWPNAASDFTPWLRENLGLLGETLGLNLTLAARGFRGVLSGYSLSILAEEAKGGKVAIDDQIGWIDYVHLGETLMQAAGCDAKHVVWVARHFDAGHRIFIDWLNRLASGKVWFYGIEIRAVKIGDSLPAPDLRVVVAPEEWWRTFPDTVASPTRYREFFGPLIAELQKRGITEEEEPRLDFLRSFHSGFENVAYMAGFDNGEEAFVCCYFEGPEACTVARALQEQGQETERSLTREWEWTHLSDEEIQIQTEMEAYIDIPEEGHDAIRAWMVINLLELKGVLTPRLEKILSEMDT